MLKKFSIITRIFSSIFILIGLYSMKSIKDELAPIFAMEKARKEYLYNVHTDEFNNRPNVLTNYDNVKIAVNKVNNNDYTVNVDTTNAKIKTSDDRIKSKKLELATIFCTIVPYKDISPGEIEALKKQEFDRFYDLESKFQIINWQECNDNYILSSDNTPNIYLNDNKSFKVHLKDSQQYLLRVSIIYNSALRNENKLYQTYNYIILN